MTVSPAVNGTHHIGTLNMQYTAGETSRLVDALRDLLAAGEPVACDIETMGLGVYARQIKTVAFATRTHAVVLNPRDPDQARVIRQFLSACRQPLVFHNAPFDVPNMYVNGLFPITCCEQVIDTLVYARLAYPDTMVKKDLDSLVDRLLGVKSEETIKQAFRRLGMTISEGFRRLDIDSPMYLMGVAVDACMTARLRQAIRERAHRGLTTHHPYSKTGVQGQAAWDLVEREQVIGQRITLPGACRGIRVDPEYAGRYRERTAVQLSAIEAELVGNLIIPGRAGDLLRVLSEQGAVPAGYPRTPKTGALSGRADDLERLDHPLAALFIHHKQVSKVLGDYLVKIDTLAIDGRIHPTVNLLVATTGRMSIGDPPLQQFPADARGIVLANEGDALSSIDWSQVEPVTAANIARDTHMLAGYEDGSSDLYTTLGAVAHVDRAMAKKTLLAQMYGEGIMKLARDLGIDPEDAKTIRSAVFAAMPRTAKLLYRLRELGEQHRKICTVAGRILDVPMGKGFDGGPPSVATHKAVNYFVQGSAYDLLAIALHEIASRGLGDAVYLAMHDEIVCSTEAAHDIDKIMQVAPECLIRLSGRVPVLRTDRQDIGSRWAKV